VPPSPLHGVVAALVTPFREDERIDCGAWQTLIDQVVAAGVDGLFVGGSTGEFFAQSLEERTMALRFVRQASAFRVPVYANVGCITTRDTIKLALAAQAEGIDFLAVVTPYYIRPSQAELAEHYTDVCGAVRIPVLAYNFPQHGGVELRPETVARVARQCENLAGVKDSSGSMEMLTAYQKAAPARDFAVFVGPESLMLNALQQGCAGVVSGSANIAPRLFVDLYRAFREGQSETAARLQALVDQLSGCLMLHTFPSVIKEAVRIAGPCRKPVGPVPPEVRSRLSKVLALLQAEGYVSHTSDSVTA
jgi:4-hydroxy-tetrahydrodipicolinate synthase